MGLLVLLLGLLPGHPGEPERAVLVRSAEAASPDHLTTGGVPRRRYSCHLLCNQPVLLLVLFISL